MIPTVADIESHSPIVISDGESCEDVQGVNGVD